MLKTKFSATQEHEHVVFNVILNHLLYWILCIIINRQFKEFVRHDIISVGLCSKRKPVKVTAKQYWSLSQHSPVTYVNQSVEQYCRSLCQKISYTCDGGSMTTSEKCLISISGSFVHSPDIKFQFLKSLLFTGVCNLLPVLIFVAFRRAHPDDATMKDVKEALSDKNIDFNKLKDLNADRCGQLSLGWWKRDGYEIGLLVEGTNCTVVCFTHTNLRTRFKSH